MSDITRNESADKISAVWVGLVEGAPETTNKARDVGALSYLAGCGVDLTGVHSDHFDWIELNLNNEGTLRRVEELALWARGVGEAVIQSPWRD